MNASDAAVSLARWLALRRQALPIQEALPGLSQIPAFDACLAFWQGEDLVVHAVLADSGFDPDEVARRAEALRQALDETAAAVPGRVRASLHVIAETSGRAERLRHALLDHADGHFLSKVLVGRSVLCLADGSAAYSGRAAVQPSADELAEVLVRATELPGEPEARQWEGRRLREQRSLRQLLKPGPAPLTWALIAVNAGVFGLQLALSQSLQKQGLGPGAADFAALVQLGANQSWDSLNGQWWRLLSAAFLHGGALHLVMNMGALFSLGSFAERLLGPWRLGAFYLAAALVSSLISSLFLPVGVPSVGASGAILGLVGLLLAPKFRRHPGFPQALAARLYQWLFQPIVLLFSLGLLFKAMDLGLQFDNAAHAGGLLCGLALGYLYPSFLVRTKHRQG